MKINVAVSLLLVLLISSVGLHLSISLVQGISDSFNAPETSEQMPSNRDVQVVSVNYCFNPINIKYYEGFARVSVEGLDRYGAPGEPILPFKTARILLPPNGVVEGIEVKPLEAVELQIKYPVEPGAEAIPTLLDEKALNYQNKLNEFLKRSKSMNETIYNSSDPFPGKIYDFVSTQTLKGFRILILRLHPVQYIPSKETIIYYRSLSVTVKLYRRTEEQTYVAETFRALREDLEHVKRVVDNPEMIAAYPLESSISTQYEYVIVTDETLVNAFQPLIEWKISKGISSTIETVQRIQQFFAGYDLQEKIRNFIYFAYLNWGTKYVLLGGDVEIIPARGLSAAFEPNIASDLYYACLDGSWDNDGDRIYGEPGEEDFYAEVYVGRAPINTYDEALTFVNKIITYEQHQYADYLNNVLMLAAKLDEITDGGITKDMIEETFLPGYYDVTKLYERDYTASVEATISELNEGQHIVNNIGHANNYVIGLACVNYEAYFTIYDVSELSNAPRLFLFYTIGCYANAFDNRDMQGNYVGDAISEYFINEPNGGAFAFIGNTRYGWYIPGYPGMGPSELYDIEFFDAIYNEDIRRIAAALQDSKEDLVGYAISDEIMKWVYYTLNLLGDPETELITPPPPEHEISVKKIEAPRWLRPGRATIINATIVNWGLSDETNIDVSLIVNGTTIDTTTIPLIGNGCSVQVGFYWSAPEVEGIYNLTVYAEPVPNESSTINNMKSTKVLVLQIPNILVVNDNDGAFYIRGTSLWDFTSVLDTLGYEYRIWDELSMGLPPLEALLEARLVIWTCGDYWNWAVDPIDAETLKAYLMAGGNILLEGEDIGFNHGNDDFMVNVAHAIYRVDYTEAPGLTVTYMHLVTFGLPTTINWLIDPWYDDGVTPTNGGFEVIRYTGTEWTAVTVFEGVDCGSVVYYAFPLYCLPEPQKSMLAANSINWLLGYYIPVDVKTDKDWYSSNEEILISASIIGDGEPVTGAEVVAYIIDPYGSTVGNVMLYDDGMHNDGEQDDGIYANTFPGISLEHPCGIYSVVVLAWTDEGAGMGGTEFIFIGDNNLFVRVINTYNEPAPYVSLSILDQSSGNIVRWWDMADNHGFYYTTLPEGLYAVMAWSSWRYWYEGGWPDKFFLLAKELIIDDDNVAVVTLNATEGVSVLVKTRNIYGKNEGDFWVDFYPEIGGFGLDVAYTDSNGEALIYVTPDFYHVAVRKYASPSYFLYKLNMDCKSATTISFIPSEEGFSRLVLSLHKVSRNQYGWAWIYPENLPSPFIFGYSADNIEVVVTPDVWKIFGGKTYIGLQNGEWYYEIGCEPTRIYDLTNPQSSATFIFGGPLKLFLSLNESYNAGDRIQIYWSLVDSYGNTVEWVYESTWHISELILTKDSGNTRMFSVAKNYKSTDYREHNPYLTIIDPEGSPIVNTEVYWYEKPKYYQLSANAMSGIYTVIMEVNTGPYQGTLSSRQQFWVGELFRITASTPLLRITKASSTVISKSTMLYVSSIGGFNLPVTLSGSWVGYAPEGVSITFLPNTVNPAEDHATSTLLITVNSEAPTGLFILNVTGTNGAVNRNCYIIIAIGELILDESNGAVYYVHNGVKHWITNPQAFSEYGFDWSWLRVISHAEAEAYPTSYSLNGFSLPPPVLLGDESTWGIYYVYGGKIHWITCPDAFLRYGFKWDQVAWIPHEIISSYASGYLLDGVKPIPRDGLLLGDLSNGAIYYMYAGKLHWITSPQAFESYGFNWEDVIWFEHEILSKYLIGYILDGINILPGRLIGDLSNGAIYYMYAGVKYWIATPQAFESYGFDWNQVIWFTGTNLKVYVNGRIILDGSNPLPDRELRGDWLTGEVYYACNGRKYWITSPQAFESYGFNWADIIWVSHTALSMMPNGYDLNGETPLP
ncbi:MAG: C25 family cysteine peptidase [Candidatus Bathyarchaeia archaeon]